MEQELNQEGAVQEKAGEATSKPASETTSTEEKATSNQDGIRKLQSMKDKAEAEARKYKESFDTVQAQVQELQEALRQQRLDAQRKEIEALTGDPEGQAAVKRRHDLEERERKLYENERTQKEAIQRMFDQAAKLSKEYNLNPGELLDARDPDSMELLAKNLILQREIEAMKQATGQPQAEGFTEDSGTSDGGGDSDEAFMKAYSEGKSDDHARAKKLMGM